MKINQIKLTNEQVDTPDARDIKLRETSRKMEAAFLTHVFKTMEKTIPKSSLLGKKTNNLSSMMFSTVMADAVAEQGGIGLGEQIYNSLKDTDKVPNLEKLKLNDYSIMINPHNILKNNAK